MPRKLPWLSEKPDPAPAEPRIKRRRVLSPDLPDDLDAPVPDAPRRKGKARATRTPSSSPPPQPPKQEFMRDGLAGDDIWMMVEDEFLDTARAFTRHLHHAEYHRLKRVAREKNASAAQNIIRPVVSRGKLSTESQSKHEARARAERQTDALRQIDNADDDLDEDAPWARDPHLGGLMSGSQDSSSSQLAKLAGIRSKTRAAAGYVGAPSKPPPRKQDGTNPSKRDKPRSSLEGLAKEIRRAQVSSDEDDLDALSSGRRTTSKESVRWLSGPSTKPADAREPSMLPPRLPKQSVHSNPLLTKQPASTSRPAGRIGVSDRPTPSSVSIGDASRTVNATTSTPKSSKSSKRKPLTSKFTFDTFAGLDDPVDRIKADGLRRNSEKSPEKPVSPSVEKQRARKKKSISADEIPTFLF